MITFTQNLKQAFGSIFESDKGACRIPNETQCYMMFGQIKPYIPEDTEIKVNIFEYEGYVFIVFQDKKDFKKKYYTLNLFSLIPSAKSILKTALPKQLKKELLLDRKRPISPIEANKEQLTDLLFLKNDEFNVVSVYAV
jgi:hypothetical protein